MDTDRYIARAIKLLFEVGSILTGLGGVIYQVLWAKGGPDAAVLLALAAIAAAPMATNLRALYPAGGSPTPAPSSPSPPQSPEAPSSSQPSPSQ